MLSIKTIQYIWKSSVLKILNIKTRTFLIVMFVTLWSYNKPLWIATYKYSYPITWCLFPFIMCDVSVLILFWFGVVYVNSDIPFNQHVNMYHILRIGRKRWALGQIGGILVRACVLTISMAIMSSARLIYRLELSNKWGKLAHTIAVNNGLENIELKYLFYYGIFDKYTPIELMLITIMLFILIVSFLGIFMFVVCLYTNKIIAITLSTSWAIMMFFVMNLHPIIKKNFSYFTPTLWGSIAKSATKDYGHEWMPSVAYMYFFLISGICIMSYIIVNKVKKMQFYWENADV